MSAHNRPWTLRILQLIDEGVRDPDEVVDRALCYVPPGHAHRVRERYLSERRRYREQAGQSLHVRREHTRVIDPHAAYEAGARRVVRRTLQSMRRSGRLVLVDGELHRGER